MTREEHDEQVQKAVKKGAGFALGVSSVVGTAFFVTMLMKGEPVAEMTAEDKIRIQSAGLVGANCIKNKGGYIDCLALCEEMYPLMIGRHDVDGMKKDPLVFEKERECRRAATSEFQKDDES